ncbi:MAG: hypothetical protein EOO07_14880, partial [Chitinophagaceae bacterium]
MENRYNLFYYRKRLVTIGVTLILIFIVSYFFIHRSQKTIIDPAFGKYIEAYTAGVISKESAIRIKLAGDVQVTHGQNEELPDDVFDFSPSVKGKAYWVDARTIEFRPEEKLEPGQVYEAEFNLSRIIDVADNYKNFDFDFQTVKPDFTVSFTGLKTATNTSLDKMKLGGIIQTADIEEPASIEKLISANYIT